MNKLVHEVALDERLKTAHVVDEDQVVAHTILISEDEMDNAPKVIEVTAVKSASDLVHYLKEAAISIPNYSTTSPSSIRRAFTYIDGLRNEIVQSASQDADYAEFTEADLRDLDQIECDLETHATKLHAALKIAESKYEQLACELKIAGLQEPNTPQKIQRVAWKASGDNFYYDSFHFSIARLLINAKVANAKNMNVMYNKLAGTYGMNERDKLSILFAMRDMGYPITNSLIGGDDLLHRYFN